MNTNYYRKCVLKTFIAKTLIVKTQTEIESVIVSVIKMRPTMCRQYGVPNALGNVKHHGLLLPLSLLLGGSHWIGLCW